MFILVVGFVVAYTTQIPNPGHGGDKVLVTIDGLPMGLQEAIDYGFLVDDSPNPTYSYTTSGDHIADEIYVSVDGDEKTLQDAILTTLCGGVSSLYTSDISFGHNSNKILVYIGGGEKSLQEAIDEGDFCNNLHDSFACYDNDVYWYDFWDEIQEKKEECGTSGYEGEAYCSGSEIYRNYVTKECSEGSCTSSTSEIKQGECLGIYKCFIGECWKCKRSFYDYWCDQPGSTIISDGGGIIYDGPRIEDEIYMSQSNPYTRGTFISGCYEVCK